MYKIFFKCCFLFLICLHGMDLNSIPKLVYSSIIKYYNVENIEVIHVEKTSDTMFLIKVKLEDEIDNIVIDNKGKIHSITESLENIEVEHGC